MNNIESWFISELKQCIIENYKTPKIQVERDIQTILSIFIEDILNCILNADSSKNRIKLICREFPIQKDNNTNESFNIDYLMADKENLYFIELKTSSNSLNEEQLNRYLNLRHNINTMYNHIDKLASNNNEEANKYLFLINKIDKVIESIGNDRIDFAQFKNIKLIYIVPSNFEQHNRYLRSEYKGDITYITLKEIAECNLNPILLESQKYDSWRNLNDLFAQLDILDLEYHNR